MTIHMISLTNSIFRDDWSHPYLHHWHLWELHTSLTILNLVSYKYLNGEYYEIKKPCDDGCDGDSIQGIGWKLEVRGGWLAYPEQAARCFFEGSGIMKLIRELCFILTQQLDELEASAVVPELSWCCHAVVTRTPGLWNVRIVRMRLTRLGFILTQQLEASEAVRQV